MGELGKHVRYVRWATRFCILFFSLGSLTLVQSSSTLRSIPGSLEDGMVRNLAKRLQGA